MTKQLIVGFSSVALVLLATTATRAQTPGALYDFRADDNSGHPNTWTNLGTLGGSLAADNGPVLTPAGGIEIAHYSSNGGGSFDILSGGDDVNVEDGFSYEIYARRTGDAAGAEHHLSAPFETGNQLIFLTFERGDAADGLDMFLRTQDGAESAIINDMATFGLNDWVHVVLTFDDVTDEFKVYENGVNIDTQTLADLELDNTPSNDVTLLKTRASEPDDRAFAGDINAARLYDFVLTPAQVTTNFNAVPTPPEFLPGDFDLNDEVNLLDFGILRDHLNAHLDGPVSFTDGDIDQDGDVDLDDFGQFKDDAFPGGAAALTAALAGVPEPSSLALITGAMAVLLGGRTSSRSQTR